VGDTGTILRTTDGGASWMRQESGTARELFAVFSLDDQTSFVVGGVILRTDDGGVTWRAQPRPDRTYFTAVSFLDGNTGTVVGQGGAILRTKTGGD
jgi:photosystem II stability/assembly factor-like uncharacterized protein